jgi:hypothetical protein
MTGLGPAACPRNPTRGGRSYCLLPSAGRARRGGLGVAPRCFSCCLEDAEEKDVDLCGKWESDYLHLLKDDARADWNDEHWVLVRAKPILHRAVISDALLLPGVCCECVCPDGKMENLGYFSDHGSARLAWRKHAGA